MYNVDGFRLTYSRNRALKSVAAGDKVFEITPFKVWFGNVRRRLFVLKEGKIALYHYVSFEANAPVEWYSYDHEDYSGIHRITARDIINGRIPTPEEDHGI